MGEISINAEYLLDCISRLEMLALEVEDSKAVLENVICSSKGDMAQMSSNLAKTLDGLEKSFRILVTQTERFMVNVYTSYTDADVAIAKTINNFPIIGDVNSINWKTSDLPPGVQVMGDKSNGKKRFQR